MDELLYCSNCEDKRYFLSNKYDKSFCSECDAAYINCALDICPACDDGGLEYDINKKHYYCTNDCGYEKQ